MSTPTTNYGLTKPDISEAADISVLNTNFDTIDTTIKLVSDVANAAQADADSALSAVTGSVKTKQATGLPTSMASNTVVDLTTISWTTSGAGANTAGTEADISSSGVVSFTVAGLFLVQLDFTLNGVGTNEGFLEIKLLNSGGVEYAKDVVAFNGAAASYEPIASISKLLVIGGAGSDTGTGTTFKFSARQTNVAAASISRKTAVARVTYLGPWS